MASNFSSDNAVAFWNQIFFDQAMARLPEQMGDAKAVEEAERVRREKRRPRIEMGDNLKCRRGQLLCNPLVFGVVEKKDKDRPRITKAIEPVCVPTPKDRRNTTRECYLKSTKIKASAVMVVAHNSALWSQFKSDLETLCNPDFNKELPVLKNRKRAIKDVNDTCAWAKVAMARKTLSEAQKARYNPNQDNSDEDSVVNEGVE